MADLKAYISQAPAHPWLDQKRLGEAISGETGATQAVEAEAGVERPRYLLPGHANFLTSGFSCSKRACYMISPELPEDKTNCLRAGIPNFQDLIPDDLRWEQM